VAARAKLPCSTTLANTVSVWKRSIIPHLAIVYQQL
jgi:hypothetical protein